MKKGTIIPLVLGVSIGGLAIKLGFNTLQKAKASAQVDIVTAVVAVDDIYDTAQITEEMVKAYNATYPVTAAKEPVSP